MKFRSKCVGVRGAQRDGACRAHRYAGAWARQSAAPAGEATLGVDDLPGDPAGLVGEQPGDEAGGVVGLAPAPWGNMAAVASRSASVT